MGRGKHKGNCWEKKGSDWDLVGIRSLSIISNVAADFKDQFSKQGLSGKMWIKFNCSNPSNRWKSTQFLQVGGTLGSSFFFWRAVSKVTVSEVSEGENEDDQIGDGCLEKMVWLRIDEGAEDQFRSKSQIKTKFSIIFGAKSCFENRRRYNYWGVQLSFILYLLSFSNGFRERFPSRETQKQSSDSLEMISIRVDIRFLANELQCRHTLPSCFLQTFPVDPLITSLIALPSSGSSSSLSFPFHFPKWNMSFLVVRLIDSERFVSSATSQANLQDVAFPMFLNLSSYQIIKNNLAFRGFLPFSVIG